MRDAGSSPTSTATRQGRMPVLDENSSVLSLTPARTAAAIAFPSISCAAMAPRPPWKKRVARAEKARAGSGMLHSAFGQPAHAGDVPPAAAGHDSSLRGDFA